MEDRLKTNQRLQWEMDFAHWPIDKKLPFKCINGKLGETVRFSHRHEALKHFEETPGRMLVSSYVNGKVKFLAYRWQ